MESSIAAGILTSLPFAALGTTHEIKKVGVQLYTVRDFMKTDSAGTIAKVASIGYKEVEFGGYFDHSPKEVRSILDKNGLTAPSCHVTYEIVRNNWQDTLEFGHTVGHDSIVCSYIEEDMRTVDGWKRVIDTFNTAGEASKKAGIQFVYHNHWWEFGPEASLGGKLPYDYLLDATDPTLVKMEMDLGWINVAGQDPIAYFKRYPGRFPMVHVKDFKALPNLAPDQIESFEAERLEHGDMVAPGSGIIDWKRIFSHSSEAGISHYFLEHDLPADPWATLTDGYKYLSTVRF